MSIQLEHINSLLDGELEPMHESSLFGELSVNSELRADFKQQLAIRSAVQNDRLALIPPVALTSSLFSGLGFAAPLAGAAAGAAGGGLLLQWLSRLGLPLLSAITAAGITFGISSQGTSPTSTTQTVLQEPTISEAQTVPAPAIEPVVVQPTRVVRNSAIESALRAEIASLRASLLAERARNEAPSTPVVASNTPTIQTVEHRLSVIDQVEVTNNMALTYSNEPRLVQATAMEPLRLRSLMYPSFLLQVRGLSAQPLTDVNVNPQSGWYDNVSLGFLYELSQSDAVGLEVGTESYAMAFEGTVNSQVIRYEQQPLATWAGATYRHTFPSIGTSPFSPFGQVLVGGTKFGPLGRLTAGITYAPAGPLTFILGIEGSSMAYRFQNAWFNSSRVGLTYGMAARF